MNEMKTRYRLTFRGIRGGMFYCVDKITGKRCTFMAFPLRWKGGDGSMIRLVAVLDPSGNYRIETGK